MERNEEAFHRIFQFVREFERQFRDQGEFDLSTTQFQALSTLREAEPLTAMAMAGLLRIAGPTATRAVDSLKRRGLIVKERDPQDRRIIWLRLTQAGRELWERQQERQLAWVSGMLQTLDNQEQRTLTELLGKLEIQAALLP